MNVVAAAPELTPSQVLAAKKKCVVIEYVAASQLPHRVTKRSTGVLLCAVATKQEVADFLDRVSLESLKTKPKRRLSR